MAAIFTSISARESREIKTSPSIRISFTYLAKATIQNQLKLSVPKIGYMPKHSMTQCTVYSYLHLP